MRKDNKQESVTFSPALRAGDALANHWLRQVTLRLRREVAWAWHERGYQQPPAAPGALPPQSDRVQTALDMSRFWVEKQEFYSTDETARYLTEQINAKPPRAAKGGAAQGSFSWVVELLGLDDAAAFVLALGLAAALDASAGSVFAAVLNDQNKTHPTFSLAQRLWDEPEAILRLANPFHPLFRTGLLRHAAHHYSETVWDAPLHVAPIVANQLLFPDAPLPDVLAPVEEAEGSEALGEEARLVAVRLKVSEAVSLRLVPVMGPRGASRRETVGALAKAAGKRAYEYAGDPAPSEDNQHLNALATACWLRDSFLFLSRELQPPPAGEGKHRDERRALPAETIPATLFLSVTDRAQLAQLPEALLLPTVHVPAFGYRDRVEFWKGSLGAKAKGLDAALAECARRFRYEKETIRDISVELKGLPGQIAEHHLYAACRAELDADIGELASRVAPRFEGEELVLPHKQDVQFAEVLKAMRSLTEVHYAWGTGRVWNEGGISVLFAGPPGTGKTMAAEVLALRLDLPMYRIDLSQVVNKYIGETEKNLRRVFDAADVSDMILFFDEADSLFGRRTEVKDAHDRYANLEISYLLERMERFKGLAILATNRKKDLDEAFMRRLRYVIDFPLPDAAEREKIWRQVVPAEADGAGIEFDFLAEQFQLTGGNIRSVVFNACLQAADGSSLAADGKKGKLTMKEIVTAVKREYDKLGRTLAPEQYGPYAEHVEALEHEPA
jgi:hypothetical protein